MAVNITAVTGRDVRPSAPRTCGDKVRFRLHPGKGGMRSYTCTLDLLHEDDHGAGVEHGRWGREQRIVATWPVAG